MVLRKCRLVQHRICPGPKEVSDGAPNWRCLLQILASNMLARGEDLPKMLRWLSLGVEGAACAASWSGSLPICAPLGSDVTVFRFSPLVSLCFSTKEK
jgi:hypothetical protein